MTITAVQQNIECTCHKSKQ